MFESKKITFFVALAALSKIEILKSIIFCINQEKLTE